MNCIIIHKGINFIRCELPITQSLSIYIAHVPVTSYPNCLHTTVASLVPHESSQTVPHDSFLHTSTRPSKLLDPPTRRTAPSKQAAKIKKSSTCTS